MTKGRRCLAALLTAALVCVLVFSAAGGCRHECSGENCPVCLLVSFCRDLLKIAALFCTAGTAAVMLCAAARAVRSCRICGAYSYLNPVFLKIKLSD